MISFFWLGASAGKDAISERMTVHHRQAQIEESVFGLEARTEIELTGKKRARRAGTFQERAHRVEFGHLEAERDANQACNQREARQLRIFPRRPMHTELCVDRT